MHDPHNSHCSRWLVFEAEEEPTLYTDPWGETDKSWSNNSQRPDPSCSKSIALGYNAWLSLVIKVRLKNLRAQDLGHHREESKLENVRSVPNNSTDKICAGKGNNRGFTCTGR